MNDKFNRVLCELFVKEQVQIDAIYASQQSASKSDDFCSYE